MVDDGWMDGLYWVCPFHVPPDVLRRSPTPFSKMLLFITLTSHVKGYSLKYHRNRNSRVKGFTFWKLAHELRCPSELQLHLRTPALTLSGVRQTTPYNHRSHHERTGNPPLSGSRQICFHSVAKSWSSVRCNLRFYLSASFPWGKSYQLTEITSLSDWSDLLYIKDLSAVTVSDGCLSLSLSLAAQQCRQRGLWKYSWPPGGISPVMPLDWLNASFSYFFFLSVGYLWLTRLAESAGHSERWKENKPPPPPKKKLSQPVNLIWGRQRAEEGCGLKNAASTKKRIRTYKERTEAMKGKEKNKSLVATLVTANQRLQIQVLTIQTEVCHVYSPPPP